MTYSRTVLLLIAGLLLASQAIASESTATVTLSDILSRMEQAENTIAGVTFDFTEEITYTLTNEKQTMGGTVTFLKPRNVRLEQDRPMKQTIISDGNKVWIFTPSY